MNILWLVNFPLPEASLLMNETPLPFGGWLVNASAILSEQNCIKIAIAFPKRGTRNFQILHGEKIEFYAFPPVGGNDVGANQGNPYFDQILEEVKPDIVHIFGTEYPHTLAMANICRKKNVSTVISIQGLVSIYAKHYMAYINQKVESKFTFRDFIKQDNLRQQQKKFEKMGRLEIEALKKVKHVIGRTTWDYACTKQINPNVNYHFCNETLRDEFYKYTWNIKTCEKFSIFVSQGSYPIKGLHFMIEAMTIILKKFPNTKLYVGGNDITKSNTLKEKLKKSSYSKYIIELIKKNNLQDKITFTGLLDEKQMCDRYLKSNVFVCPSSIENSPNSLGEAMILGVPCVASDVGGITDLLIHKKEGFVYQMDAPYMLAHYICEIFNSDELAQRLSLSAKEHAQKTHDRTKNLEDLLVIYEDIVKNNYIHH